MSSTGRHWTDRCPAISLGKDNSTTPPSNVLRVHCSQCRTGAQKPWKSRLPPTAYANFFRNAGWIIDEKLKSAVCPKCQAKNDKVADMSAEASKRQRQMMHLLDDHFDEDQGRYVSDWSDERVAKETGLAGTFVSKFREDAYGPIRVHPALTQASDQLIRAKEKIAADIAAVRAMADGIERDAAADFKKIEDQLASAMRGAA